ncbi:MAG: TIGR03086 family protein [Chloroflexi bacterium]|nr:TIGR03086 family protein [Chloroflexota bacterium]
MDSVLDQFNRAAAKVRQTIAGVKPEQWSATTNTDWDVKGVANHVVLGLHFATEWAHGRLQSMDEAIPLRQRDWVGDDALGAYNGRLAEFQQTIAAADFATRMVKLPYMPQPIPGEAFVRQRLVELAGHAWDLASSTGQDTYLDADICETVYDDVKPMERMLRQSGNFGPHVDVPEDADIHTRMLAILGRKA